MIRITTLAARSVAATIVLTLWILAATGGL